MDLYSMFREQLTPGMVLHTSTSSPFTIESVLSGRLIIKAGITVQSFEIPFEAFVEVYEYLQDGMGADKGCSRKTKTGEY